MVPVRKRRYQTIFSMGMFSIKETLSGSWNPDDRQDGVNVPGAIKSGCNAESREGTTGGGGLSTGSPVVNASVHNVLNDSLEPNLNPIEFAGFWRNNI